MKKISQVFQNNKGLLKFISLSYVDKAIVFVVPLLVLYLFNDQSSYVEVEYIYSIVVVLVPFLDLGLSGYFFYYYRESNQKREAIQTIFRLFFISYIVLFTIGILLICIHYFVWEFESYIIYVTSRCLFVTAFMFLSSYYRLINNPKKALFVTMGANLITLAALVVCALLGFKINLFLIFIGQILFCVYFFYRAIKKTLKQYQLGFDKIIAILKGSILFSWPTILQVFLLMYVANYGKLKSLDLLTLDETTLLALTQRYAMLIQLMHASIMAFIIKEVFMDKQKSVNVNLLAKYLGFLFLSAIVVVVMLYVNWYFKALNIEIGRVLLISALIISYTLLWCVYTYLETFFSRENKNILKLYLAMINTVVFVAILYIANLPFLEKIAYAMFISITVSLIAAIIILKRRGYYFAK